MLEIGDFKIKPISGTTSVWLCKGDGEGMQASKEQLYKIIEKAIQKFWDENF